MKNVIKNSDTVFATGVFLVRDTNTPGGWQVQGFEDETYCNGELLNVEFTEDGKVVYFTETEDDEEDVNVLGKSLIPEFGTKEWNDVANKMFGGK